MADTEKENNEKLEKEKNENKGFLATLRFRFIHKIIFQNFGE